METFRNKFVIRQESGHPGYCSTTILATREDLAALSDEIRKKLAEGYQPPFVSHYATEAHGQSCRVYLQFEPATERELDEYHKTKNSPWSWFIRPALGLLVVSLTIIGGLSVWHWLLKGSWWR
ncbi:MAG: hypothetical protein JNN01_06400 [Opitutaceae bacterium]|nr:hypothetical protein [Opitutaceae bacterium]